MIPPHPLRLLPIAAMTVILSACAAPTPESTPAPAPTERPNPWPTMAPNPSPAPAPPSQGDWRAVPITQGDWSYTQAGNISSAEFRGTAAGARLAIRCDRSTRQVTILRPGSAPAAIATNIRTESGAQVVRAEPQGGQFPALVVTLGAQDSLLDRIAFSGGRFAVETAGLPTLYLPPYVEISRVVEDCRS